MHMPLPCTEHSWPVGTALLGRTEMDRLHAIAKDVIDAHGKFISCFARNGQGIDMGHDVTEQDSEF